METEQSAQLKEPKQCTKANIEHLRSHLEAPSSLSVRLLKVKESVSTFVVSVFLFLSSPLEGFEPLQSANGPTLLFVRCRR